MNRLHLAAGLLALPFFLPVAAQAQPIQGVYIGGSFGANFLDTERLRNATPSQTLHYLPGYAGLASLGYALGNGVRFEVEGSYRFNHIGDGGASSLGGNETKYGAMANVLFDMDIGSRYIFPYIGAGAGYQDIEYSLFDYPAGRTENVDKGAFAYQAMLGAAFPIPGVVGLSATAEYRYLGTTGNRTYIHRVITEDDNHSVMVGLRYAFNVTPPAPAPASVAAVAAPAPAPARTYLVFFDWDQASLTPRGRQIIASAADASTHVALTRIDVSGYTDTSGTPAYNQVLSRRRADNVASELIRHGVPKASIAIRAFGETHPLVPTGPGVREPQNRRVEIVLR